MSLAAGSEANIRSATFVVTTLVLNIGYLGFACKLFLFLELVLFETICFREYVTMVVFFFIVSTANNMAFNFNISMTLHLIFRAVRVLFSTFLGALA